MRLVLLLALSLAFASVVIAPSASAACTGDDPVASACANALCTVKEPAGPWTMDCWGIVGPPI